MSTKAFVGRALRETGAALKVAGGMEIFTRHRPIMSFMGNKPFVTNDTFVAPSASVIGNVTHWDESSVWYGAVVRADSHEITIGFSSNVQDRAVVNTLSPKVKTLKSGFPPACHIGHYVSIGAGSTLTSCRIEDLVEVGDKCIIGEGAVVESHVILEPGTVVAPYTKIPSGQRWAGNPAQYVEDLDDEAKDHIQGHAEKIHITAQEHALEFLPIGNTYVHLEELEKKGVQVTQG
mmetsp:Transcript_6447/g.9435  ORF Transcript_6447/g.9435 Transcript_6447/m.9435 type:complete len:234 (-) Transcript_6447:93-794(-)|eukprot:CAMPEP_0197239208 /NCGR_PEP_ID=MMETSP1429-20130617/5714_1 /TAXON_ID=49237 /ORGANISM="Chaetoceros  sp., Strain UNC1202" /LENGTH=233 /DNA_ID=CAMNT_0042698587 /DNA_START=25 /DNA_END=726 /DNA_ORIENTATION=+